MDRIPGDDFDAALTLTEKLEYLPASKGRELARVLEIMFDEVQAFQAHKLSERKRSGKVLKVILYGSYARGDWVQDRVSGYRSDYDLLIVVNHQNFADEDVLWIALDERLTQAQIAHHIETPVIPIVHSLADVNDKLARGRPFFIDVIRDGRILYEAPGYPLADPKMLTQEAASEEARANFGLLFSKADRGLETVDYQISRIVQNSDWAKDAAFALHQATESLYHCLLLTLTLYSPKSHRVKILRSMSEYIDSRLVDVWPRDSRMARRRFELLSRAYVEARYSSHYKITIEELEWLTERVKTLQQIVEQICRERLDRTAE